LIINGIHSACNLDEAKEKDDMTEQHAKPQRADALRNRQRLLEAAVQAFAEQGTSATPAAIAKRAGVGVGTLYRHFPTREALVDAAYRHEVDQLCAAVPDLLANHSAAQALRIWADRFLHYASTKRGMTDALAEVIASGADPYTQSRAMLTTATGTLLAAGAADRTLRPDLSDDDVLLSLSGVAQATGGYGTPQQASRLLDLLMDALTRT
jgi:AcrR family transcriptional regulator